MSGNLGQCSVEKDPSDYDSTAACSGLILMQLELLTGTRRATQSDVAPPVQPQLQLECSCNCQRAKLSSQLCRQSTKSGPRLALTLLPQCHYLVSADRVSTPYMKG